METRFDRTVNFARNINGAERATLAMVQLQAIFLLSTYVNFFRIKIREGRFSEIYPSVLVLLEAPSSSGKNKPAGFMEEEIFGFPFSVLRDWQEQRDHEYRKKKIEEIHLAHPGDDKEANKAEKAVLSSFRPVEIFHFDDGSYEGFAMDRAHKAQIGIGAMAVICKEYADRLRQMKQNVYLATMYGRMLELIDNDKLGRKSIKDSKGSTPASGGMGMSLFYTTAPMELKLRESVKSQIIQTMGRRGFILRETNETVRYRTDCIEPDPEEVEALEREITELTYILLDLKPEEKVITFSADGRRRYEEIMQEHVKRQNAAYDLGPSEDKDTMLALMADIDRKTLKLAGLLAVFNHGEFAFEIGVADINTAYEIVLNSYQNSLKFFDMSAHQETNRLISYLQFATEPVSAKQLLEAGFFPKVPSRGWQEEVHEIMTRDIEIKLNEIGFTLEVERYNRQYRYSMAKISEEVKNKLDKQATIRETEKLLEKPRAVRTIDYIFSCAEHQDVKNTHSYELMPFTEIAKALKGETSYSPFEFKDSTRLGSNFLRCNLIMLDFDDGMTLQEGLTLFKNYEAIIATTRNHQKVKGSHPACDRFRVILKSDIEFNESNKDDYKLLMEHLTKKFGSDPACKDLARFFYGSPESKVVKSKGTLLFPSSIYLDEAKSQVGRIKTKRYQNAERKGGSRGSFLIRIKDKSTVDALQYIESFPADDSTYPIFCPWHEDKSPSAFVSHLQDDSKQVTCLVCSRTEWVE